MAYVPTPAKRPMHGAERVEGSNSQVEELLQEVPFSVPKSGPQVWTSLVVPQLLESYHVFCDMQGAEPMALCQALVR